MLRPVLRLAERGGPALVALALLTILCAPGLASGAEVNVGPTRALKTLQAGISAARPGDRVVLDAGVYIDDVASIDKPLIIEGAGRGAVLRITKPISNRKGILVVNADLTIRKITLEGAFVTDADGKNGAGIRHQAGHLTVDTCVFANNQNGILANANKDASISIRRSAFHGNGGGDGYTHGIYVNQIDRLIVTDSTFAGTKVGHNIKSRAYRTTITDTVLDDGVSGTPSYAIDLPNGGEVLLKGVSITQGQRTSNTTMVAYGAEKSLHGESSLTVVGSTFVNRAAGAIGINNFTSITVMLENNSFQNVGEIFKGAARLTNASPAPMRNGAVFSSVDPNARSYLRFHNTGADAGTVTVRLFDGRNGSALGGWTSPPILPNAAPQFGIEVLEAALGVLEKPSTYSIVISTAMRGTFQHVLHRPGSGVLSNLSTCSAGVARGGRQLANVHSSGMDVGYPASIAVQNLGPLPASAQIGFYDARNGQRAGVFTSPEIPVDGELILRVAAMEAAARIAPAWDMAHWVLRIENDFSGSLQQLIANQSAGVVTDMTTVCALNAVNAERKPMLGVGAVFAVSPELESLLRVHNTGLSAATMRIAVFDAITGTRLTEWESPALAPNASRQFSVSSILPSALTAGDAPPPFYRISIASGFSGYAQHVVRHATSGAYSNLSSCDAGTTASLADVSQLRSTANAGADVALIVLYNTGGDPSAPSLEVFDAIDGRLLGAFGGPPIVPDGNAVVTVADVEAALSLAPASGIGAYNVRLKDGFTGFMQYLLVSVHTGAVTDMSTACAIGPTPR